MQQRAIDIPCEFHGVPAGTPCPDQRVCHHRHQAAVAMTRAVNKAARLAARLRHKTLERKPMTISKRIRCNPFVFRQTPDSPHSHFAGTWELLEDLVVNELRADNDTGFREARKGDAEGCLLVSVPPRNFFTGIVDLTPDSQITATFAPRRKGEDGCLQITAKGKKRSAGSVEIVLYTHVLLGKDAAHHSEWEIVSINASPNELPTPIDPMTMARNFLGLEGGTKTVYTNKQFAEAILFYNTHALRTP